MQIINSQSKFKNEDTAVVVGKFDCLHLGHMEIIDDILSRPLKSLVFTFSESPRIILSHSNEPVKNILTNAEKEKILEGKNIDYLLYYEFSKEFMSLSPEDYIRLLVEKYHMKYISAMDDFRFGSKNSGDTAFLQSMAQKYGYKCHIVPAVRNEDDEVITSTLIRSRISEGRIKSANDMLGYDYFVSGKIVHGRGMGKKVLDFPTINLIPDSKKLLPPNGAYVTKIEFPDGKIYGGMTNIGFKPTVSGKNHLGIETHIFDFDHDVYGRDCRVIFLKYIRPEKKFDSLTSLSEQLSRDKEFSKQYFIHI